MIAPNCNLFEAFITTLQSGGHQQSVYLNVEGIISFG